MLRLDAHQHFWNYDPVRDSWITEDMSVIRRDFLPVDLEPLLAEAKADGCIAVQADQSANETRFLLALAAQYPFIKGVVGWVDLRHEKLEEQLEQLAAFGLLKGFRHILQGEKQRDLVLEPQFRKGLQVLGKKGYTYDILIHNDQIGYASQLCQELDDQYFILDHLAKPSIRIGAFREWHQAMQSFRGMDHVYCKVSGLVTEADWEVWTPGDLQPYLDAVVEIFGISRLVFGSDWPVCLLAAGYGRVWQVMEDYFEGYSHSEKALIFGGNAQRFYHIKEE